MDIFLVGAPLAKFTSALLIVTGGRTGAGGHCLSGHRVQTADSSEMAVQHQIAMDRHGAG